MKFYDSTFAEFILQHLFDLICVLIRQHNPVCSRRPYSLFLLAFLLPLIHLKGSVTKVSKCDYTLEKKSKEKHKCDILKENSSRKILFW